LGEKKKKRDSLDRDEEVSLKEFEENVKDMRPTPIDKKGTQI